MKPQQYRVTLADGTKSVHPGRLVCKDILKTIGCDGFDSVTLTRVTTSAPHTIWRSSTPAFSSRACGPTAENYLSKIKTGQLLELGAHLFDPAWAKKRKSE